MKEVIRTIGEIFAGIGLFAVIFLVIWAVTSADIIGVFFVATVLFTTVFLPILIEMEE